MRVICSACGIIIDETPSYAPAIYLCCATCAAPVPAAPQNSPNEVGGADSSRNCPGQPASQSSAERGGVTGPSAAASGPARDPGVPRTEK